MKTTYEAKGRSAVLATVIAFLRGKGTCMVAYLLVESQACFPSLKESIK